MNNPFTQPFDILSPEFSEAANTVANQAGIGKDGFLTKAGETLLDLVGLYGASEIAKNNLEASAGSDRQDPQITDSQRRAGVEVEEESPVKSFIEENRLPLYFLGGVAAFGVIAVSVALIRK